MVKAPGKRSTKEKAAAAGRILNPKKRDHWRRRWPACRYQRREHRIPPLETGEGGCGPSGGRKTRRHLWLPEEDEELAELVKQHGTKWSYIASMGSV
ncbi:uncharacterized protein J3R85_016508 [Psidium guajava]|nr:uncharacterized protein J3R85_016508 [Psidium guajava]